MTMDFSDEILVNIECKMNTLEEKDLVKKSELEISSLRFKLTFFYQRFWI